MPPQSYAQAASQVRSYARAILENVTSSMESVALADSLHRVLASAIVADRDQPPFPRSTRDGFACRAADAVSHQPMFIAGRLRAGDTPSTPLEPGQAWEIMTGAPTPDGADAVFMIEHAEATPDRLHNFVQLRPGRSLHPGDNIVPRAAEARQGDLLLPPGTRISAAQIALAAQCGYSRLSVCPRPRIALLATGDELVPIDHHPGPSQIRNSNTSMLAALVTAVGAKPLLFPTVPDNQPAVDAAIQSVLAAQPDMLLITGGISAGRFDLVEDGLLRAGAEFFFHGVAIQPGKPVAFGHLPTSPSASSESPTEVESPEPLREAQSPGRLVLLALPGNPISSAATFHLFAAPLIAALAGDTSASPRFASAHLQETWHGKPGLTRFLPALCDFALSPRVRIVPWQGSGDLVAFARSNCFAVIPDGPEEISDGAPIQILLT